MSTTEIEQRTTINAPPADIFAVLAAVEPVLEACAGLTVTSAKEGIAVIDTRAERAAARTFSGEVRVTESEAPTSLTMTFDGATESTVTWTLGSAEHSTLVTGTATASQPASDRDGPISGGKVEAAGGESSASNTQLSTVLDDMLTSLQTLCEQPSPPASMATGVAIPEVYCPFPAEINPHLEDVTAHTQEWAQKMGLIDEPSSKIATLSYFAGRIYPQAPPEALRLCNDWNCWGFLLDDATDSLGPDEMQHVQQPLLAVLDGDSSGPYQDPLVRALADINQRASARMPPTWTERFGEHHRDLFAGFRWEARNRETTAIPDYHDFIQNRQDFCGGMIVFDLMEVAMDSSPLPTEVYQEKAVTALREAALNSTAWTNGVYSLHRELADDAIHNHVVIVRHEQGCSLQEAVTRTCELIEAETRRFEALSRRLTVAFDTDPILQAYISGLEHALSGNLAWSKKSARYGDIE